MQYIRNGRMAVKISENINDKNINKKIESMQRPDGAKTGVTSSTHVRMHMQPMQMVCAKGGDKYRYEKKSI
jgi:hypothetical protein